MKARFFLMIFASLLLLNAYTQRFIGISQNCNYVAFKDVGGQSYMADKSGKVLYNFSPGGPIDFTADGNHFFCNQNKDVKIYSSANGKLVKSVRVKNDEKLTFSNDLTIYACQNGYHNQSFYRVGEFSPYLTVKAAYLKYSSMSNVDWDFKRNFVVARDSDKAIGIYNLSNPESPILIKMKEVYGIAIDKATGNILLGTDPNNFFIYSPEGKKIAQHKNSIKDAFEDATEKCVRYKDGSLTYLDGEKFNSSYTTFFTDDSKYAIKNKGSHIIWFNIERRKDEKKLSVDEILGMPENSHFFYSLSC